MNVSDGKVRPDPQRPGWYVIQYRIDDRRMKARGRTEADAFRVRGEQIAAARTAPRGDRTVTLSTALPRFQRTRGVRAKSTRENQQRAVRQLIAVVGDKPIAKVTRNDCEQVLAAKAVAGRRKGTLSLWRKAINPLFVWAVREGLMPANPLDGIDTGGYGAARPKDRRYYNVAEADQLTKHLAADLSDEHMAALLMLWAGLRVSEALGLEWDDVDLDAALIEVRQQADGAGGITQTLKTHRSYRTVHIGDALTEPLAEWRAMRPDATLVCSATTTTLTDRRPQEALKALTARVGMKYVNPHGLRHTAGSMLYTASKDLAATAAFLGDSLAEATRVYIHDLSEVRAGPLLDALRAGRLA